MLKSLTVSKIDGEGTLWDVPPDVAQEFGLKENHQVTLRCGALSIRAKIKTEKKTFRAAEHMGLSRKALESLNIPVGSALCIKPVKQKEFHLGPVIGVLTFNHVINKKKFTLYKYYAKKMKQIGLFYVFGPQNLQPGRKSLTGYLYDETGDSWQSRECPYPDAVMDRMYPNNYDTHRILENVIGDNKIFNKKTLINKLEFYTALEKDPFLQNLTPETRPFLQPSDLQCFLNRYREVFLKPIDGMKGRGIVYIKKDNGRILCRYMDGKNPVTQNLTRAEYIFGILDGLNSYKRPYIIQPGIDRMKCRNRPFNFRVMVMKDGSGNWTVPAIFSKIAVPGGFLTNNSSGAEFILLRDLFKCIKSRLPCTETELCSQLKEISLRAAVALDNEFGPLGKLGMDVVIDSAGKLWLIEANGNPGLMRKAALGEYPDWLSRSFDYHLSYALYLAGFSELGFIPSSGKD